MLVRHNKGKHFVKLSCAGPRLAAELRLRCWRPGQPARRAVEAAPEMEVE